MSDFVRGNLYFFFSNVASKLVYTYLLAGCERVKKGGRARGAPGVLMTSKSADGRVTCTRVRVRYVNLVGKKQPFFFFGI